MELRELAANSQPEIIVMVGLPGSGKSTWINSMLAKSDADYEIISSDNEIERLAAADGLDYNTGFDRYIGKATAIMKEKFREAVNTGKNIIQDQTNLSAKKRRSILSQVPDNYRKIAVVFNLTDDELKRRLSKREQEGGKSIPAHVMKNMARSFQPPTKAEGFDAIVNI